MDMVTRYHGLPDTIISDHGTQFDNNFWTSYWKQLGVTTALSSSYHPKTDGQL